MRLSGFTALTFDVYGTIIDWENGLLDALRPWLRRHGCQHDDGAILALFAEIESRLEAAHPRMLYPEILAAVHRDMAQRLGLPADETAAAAFGRSVPDWPAFPDSAAALQYLRRHFKLALLSNVDDRSLAASIAKLGVGFELTLTAEQVGSYKPDLGNFRFALGKLRAAGIAQEQLLHVAQSLYHDHAPCAALGIASAWIDRRAGKDGSGATLPVAGAVPKLRFTSLAEFAARHRAELAPGSA